MSNKFLVVLLSCVSLLELFAQQIEMGPITSMRELNGSILKSSSATIDSTFIFSTDTLNLPIFDDFSSNKFQEYNEDYADPNLTSSLYFHLTDPITMEPIQSDVGFTNQPTFRRVFDLANGSFNDSLFSPVNIRVGDLSSYPVQYEGEDLFPPFYLIDTINDVEINNTDTIWLENPDYLQDSARVFFQSISNPEKYWLDNFAFHNYRFGLNPHSLGVVTFDGLDENGNPYQFGAINSNYADVFTSKPINLGSYNVSDSVYLTFLYQPEGLGDIPESNDSLLLEFYSPLNQNWTRVWAIEGSPVHDFKAVSIGIAEENYFQNGFQFRFRNYGSLAGSLDHFHIDYIHLRSLSNVADTLNKDFAFTYPIHTLLKDYTSVPWDHYVENEENHMNDSLKIMLYNGSDLPENYQDGLIDISYNGLTEGSVSLAGFNLAELNINYQPRHLHTSFNSLVDNYEFDRSKIGPKQLFKIKTSASAQFPNFPGNDSTLFEQEFYNYYSYDDGSAEAAFGPTGVQSRLAIQFQTYVPDSVIGIAICFVPSVNDVSSKQFVLCVWDDDDGVPGNLLYQDDIFFPRHPIFGYGKNMFHQYFFMDTMKVHVDNKFHIGFKQFEGDRLNVGLDRNIDKSQKINYSIDGESTWIGSPFPGTAMIRPIFSTNLDDQLQIIDAAWEDFIVFPNPCDNILHISSENFEKGYLLNLEGRTIFEFYSKMIDVSNLTPGIYFIAVNEFSKVKKIIIK